MLAAISSFPAKLSGIDSGTPPVFRVTTRMPCGPSSQAHCRRRPSMASRAILKPPSPGRVCGPSPPKCQDHARPALDHVPGGCPGRQELRPHRGRDRLQEILNRYLSQRLLDVSVRDDVERDIDRAGLLDHRIDIRVNRPLVEGIDDGGVGYAAIRADLVGDRCRAWPWCDRRGRPWLPRGQRRAPPHRRSDRPRRRSRQPCFPATLLLPSFLCKQARRCHPAFTI